MIKKIENYFVIETKNLSYVFNVNKVGYLIHDYFGNKISNDIENLASLGLKEFNPKGTSVVVDEDVDPSFSPDNQLLEISFTGKGDFKEPAVLLRNDNGLVFDFRFFEAKINTEIKDIEILPMPTKMKEELIISLKDVKEEIFVDLHYLINDEFDVIVRNTVIRNNSNKELQVRKASSLQFDTINQKYNLVNLNGAWIGETHISEQKINRGIYINDSKCGTSSNRHNPFFLIKEEKANEEYGEIYAFNLMYSGNHQELVELNSYDHIHIQTGINPALFEWILKDKDAFITPFALMTYSSKGTNLSSKRMSDFINECVVNEQFSKRLRPVLINNWEGTYFKFNEAKLLKIAKSAKTFGIELFVLDDGWFGSRNNDTSGLGDYNVNKKKLPNGLKGLANKINKLGLKFGLWFEPESVNEDSDLYRAHPEYAIKLDGIKPSKGRHQLSLDLTNVDVQNYIIDNVSNILNSANIEYVKWDMNRNITDFPGQGDFHHKYVLGLYRVIRELTTRFPNVLFENCSSGGNRFDLGMLHYFPQTWASDCSDPYERISIQEGLYLGYPQSCVTGHVSSKINAQTLRQTNFQTKFSVAAFTCLGYELCLDELTPVQGKAVKEQIEFYKTHRKVFQYGKFSILKSKTYEGDNAMWMVKSKNNDTAIVGYFNGLQSATPRETVIKNLGLDGNSKYSISVFCNDHEISEFGDLINYISPIHLNPNGSFARMINNHKSMNAEKEKYIIDGHILNNGLILKAEWAGNGFDDNVRLLGDFGARLYIINRIK